MLQLEVNDRIARILFDALQGIYTLILTPISLYYAYQLWKLHKKRIPFIDKRRPQTVFLVVLLLNIYTIIIEPIVDISQLKYFQPLPFGMFHIRAAILHTMHIIVYLILYRLWLLYYDYIRSKQTLSIQWKIHLLHVNEYIPWTLKFKWLGKANIMFILTFTLWLLSLGIMQAGTYIDTDYFGPLRIILTIPLLLGSIIIGFKIRRSRDLFLIKREVMWTTLTIIIALILAVVAVIFSSTFSNFRVLSRNIISAGFCYSCSFISTQWVIKQYKQELIKRQLMESTDNNQTNKISFKLLLSTKDGFKTFANHLVKELSAEHLFFLYEMMTIKKDLIDAKVLAEDNAYIIPMDYMQNKRKSSRAILDMNDINNKLMYIIEEYIDPNGDYAVNISGDTRNCIMNILNDINMINMLPSNDERPQLTMIPTTTNSFNTFNTETKATPVPTPDKLYVMSEQKFQMDGMEIIYEDKKEGLEMENKDLTPVPVVSTEVIMENILIENENKEYDDQKQIVLSSHVKGKPIEKQTAFLSHIKVDNSQISVYNNTLDITPNTATPITPAGIMDIETEENVMKINGYMEKFDAAIMEVLRLLGGDSLLRFYQTEEYQILYKNNYSTRT